MLPGIVGPAWHGSLILLGGGRISTHGFAHRVGRGGEFRDDAAGLCGHTAKGLECCQQRLGNPFEPGRQFRGRPRQFLGSIATPWRIAIARRLGPKARRLCAILTGLFTGATA
uniref:hypothetical protein n=1 Tax=Paracoccus sp. UBA5162 TaxID=1947054 RepID=UPI0025EC3408